MNTRSEKNEQEAYESYLIFIWELHEIAISAA